MNSNDFLARQRVLAEFGELAIRTEDLNEILLEGCRLVGRALNVDRSKILEIIDNGRKIVVRAANGWTPDIIGIELGMDDTSSETFSIKAGKPVITTDISRETRFEVPQFMKDAGVASLVNVPIFLPGNKAYGLLQVDGLKPMDFRVEDTEFLRTYAMVLGPVIDRLKKLEALRSSQERYGLIVESARDYAIFMTDADDRIVDWHAGAENVFGWSPDEAIGMSGSEIFTDEDRLKGEDRKEIEMAGRQGSAPNVRWHKRKDGKRVFIEGSVVRLRYPDGSLRGFLKIGQDMTERHRSDHELRESEARQRALVEALPQLVWRSGDHGNWTWASPQWREFTGQPEEESLGQGWLRAVHPEDLPIVNDAWNAARSGTGLDCEYRIRRFDGAYIWHHTRSVRVGGDDATEWIGTSTDVQQLKEMQDRQEIMLSELQHRTRNIVAVIRALADKTLDASDSVKTFREDFGHRLASISRVQGLLSRLTDLDRISFGELLEAELSAHAVLRSKITLDGPASVRLRSRSIQTFALAIHELATNAIKYGALSSADGHLSITWRLEDDEVGQNLLYVEWRETGVEMPLEGEAPRGSGYGRELIERALPYQLKAKTTYKHERDGVHCTILAPIAFDG